MYDDETDKLFFDYDIPIDTEFELSPVPGCPICDNPEINEETAPFFDSTIPLDELIEWIQRNYNITLSEEDCEEHCNHINGLYDEEMKERTKEDMKIIDSDIAKVVDEEDVIESTIRALYARRLFLEKTNEYGAEWVKVTQSLEKWVTLKLKKDKKIEDTPGTSITFGDLVGGNDDNNSGKADPAQTKPNKKH